MVYYLKPHSQIQRFFFPFLLHKLFEEAPLGWKMSLHLLHPSDHMLPEQVLFFSLQLGVAGHGG